MIELPTWQHALVLASAAINLGGTISYVRSTLAGRTKPNRVTWCLWALAPLIAVGAALSSHADIWATVPVFLAGLMPLLVLGASFANKSSYWKLTAFDLVCGAWSVVALGAWLLADAPEVAIVFAILADAFAAAPTVKKAWQHPETENGFNFFAIFVSLILVIPSIPVWDIANASFQAYLIVVNALLTFAVYRKRLNA